MFYFAIDCSEKKSEFLVINEKKWNGQRKNLSANWEKGDVNFSYFSENRKLSTRETLICVNNGISRPPYEMHIAHNFYQTISPWKQNHRATGFRLLKKIAWLGTAAPS